MHKDLKIWNILYLTVLFLNATYSFKCPTFFSGNCTCFTSDDTYLICPRRGTNQIQLKISKKNDVTLQCVNDSDGYIALLPKINLFHSNRLSVERCDFYTEINEILNRLNITTTVKQLSFKNIKKTVMVTKELFKSMQDLERLIFSYSKINFSSEFLKNTPNLSHLTLNNVGLVKIVMNLKYTPKLQQLYLSMNQIGFISDGTLNHLHDLTHLYLDSNNISTITKNTFTSLSSLQLLDLSKNNIVELAKDTFADLDNLVHISLEGNKIKELYGSVFRNNGQLKTLLLQGNRITDLKETVFEKCTKLEQIVLKENQISFLSNRTFEGLERLKILDISSNKLTSLNWDIFSPLISLKNLALSYNKLDVINITVFEKLSNLSTLDLQHNKISRIVYEYVIPYEGHRYSNNLIMDLSHNRLTEYPNLIMLKLKKLDLSFNRIDYFSVVDLLVFPISDVDLSHNKIKHVDILGATFLTKSNIAPLCSVNLENNPIECDCSNYDLVGYNNGLYEHIKTNIKIRQEGLVCWNNNSSKLVDLKPVDIDCPLLDNSCPYPCHCTYKPYNGDLTVNCSSKNLTRIPLSIKSLAGKNLSKLITNREATIIHYLDLSENLLESIDWFPDFIKELNLNGNRIKNFDHNSITVLKNRSTLERLHLKNNPWECNCQSLDFQKYLMEHFLEVNSSDVYCQNVRNKLINIKDICPKPLNGSAILAYVLGTLFCFAIIFAFYFRYQKQIKTYLFKKNWCLWMVSEEELDKDKKYDVFISYSTQDEKFVTDNLLYELEQGDQPFKVCIHLRDWIPGEFISDQIFNSIKESRKTIIVLSNNFIESIWGKLEFRIAHNEAVSEGRNKIVVIKYGDIDEDNLEQELKHYLKTNTYITWGDPYFWKKLNNVLSYQGEIYCKKNKTKLQSDVNPAKSLPQESGQICIESVL